ncbi:MAG: RtcB family protein [Spirochaetes bacterium]|nr:RtcB family protein [Spirochaetota bacterium]
MVVKKKGRSFYEIRPEGGMRVPAYAYISDEMAGQKETTEALGQLANVACLPGVRRFVVAMPDIHYGYGFPIGGVCATDPENGVISPGGVGYDINCGVRAIGTSLTVEEIRGRIEQLLVDLYRTVPAGVGSAGNIRLSNKDERRLVGEGALWAVTNGFGEEEDLLRCEDGGRMEGAEYSAVSAAARERGRTQLGTLGAGNHFLEISYVSRIFDPDAAAVYGLFEGGIVVLLHTGSRGFGYQICDDYLAMMRTAHTFEPPDPQLVSVYLKEDLGARYLAAMRAAANFAWANRQVLTSLIRGCFERTFGRSYTGLGMSVVYDVSHNIARLERHEVEGKKMVLCVHRKGATRAFGPGHPDLRGPYGKVGQPVLIPGDMGTASYILKGTAASMDKSFGTACHGAGRILSRRKAVKEAQHRDIQRELGDKGIVVMSRSDRTLKEEMPEAYKDVSEVVEIVEQNDLARKVARLVPVGVIKG